MWIEILLCIAISSLAALVKTVIVVERNPSKRSMSSCISNIIIGMFCGIVAYCLLKQFGSLKSLYCVILISSFAGFYGKDVIDMTTNFPANICKFFKKYED